MCGAVDAPKGGVETQPSPVLQAALRGRAYLNSWQQDAKTDRHSPPPPSLLIPEKNTQAREKLAARETMLREANRALESSRREAETLQHGLKRALARKQEEEAAGAFQEERRAAREKIAELESAIERSEREHGVVRERAEGRLELLRSAMEQEEQENASQVPTTVGSLAQVNRGHTRVWGFSS